MKTEIFRSNGGSGGSEESDEQRFVESHFKHYSDKKMQSNSFV